MAEEAKTEEKKEEAKTEEKKDGFLKRSWAAIRRNATKIAIGTSAVVVGAVAGAVVEKKYHVMPGSAASNMIHPQ